MYRANLIKWKSKWCNHQKQPAKKHTRWWWLRRKVVQKRKWIRKRRDEPCKNEQRKKCLTLFERTSEKRKQVRGLWRCLRWQVKARWRKNWCNERGKHSEDATELTHWDCKHIDRHFHKRNCFVRWAQWWWLATGRPKERPVSKRHDRKYASLSAQKKTGSVNPKIKQTNKRKANDFRFELTGSWCTILKQRRNQRKWMTIWS